MRKTDGIIWTLFLLCLRGTGGAQTVVIVRENPISKKPYVLLVSKDALEKEKSDKKIREVSE